MCRLSLTDDEARVLGQLLTKTIESNSAVLEYYEQHPYPSDFMEHVRTKVLLETQQLVLLNEKLLNTQLHNHA